MLLGSNKFYGIDSPLQEEERVKFDTSPEHV